jgi:Ig-like domain from next to BRCA1 gene
MKRSLSLSVILITFLLTACTGASEASPTTTPTSMANEIYTIVAQIMESQATPVPPTATPAPTVTTMHTPTKTTKGSTSTAPILQAVSYTSSVCDDSVYVSDVTIPDYTEITSGETFTKTWMLQNTGTCAWTETYTLDYISGSSMSGVSTFIGQSVVSGETVEVSVELTAPTTAGTYTGYWQLSNDAGTSFGASFFVLILVPDTVTSTPTLTSEYTATATDTISSTSTPTATTAVTSTATTVPEVTSTPTATATIVPTATSTTEVTTEETGTD